MSADPQTLQFPVLASEGLLLPLVLDEYIHAIENAASLDEVFRHLLDYVQNLGFERMAYVVRWPAESTFKVLALTNHPDEWVSHYQNKRLAQNDYVSLYANRTVTPFIWSQLLAKVQLSRRQRMVFSDAMDAGMRAGATIPLHGPIGAKALLTVTNNMEDMPFQRLFLSARHELFLVATFAHEKIMNLKLNKKLAETNPLTPREMEILTWMARGKTRAETGNILKIKEDTVRVNLATIRQKIDAGNTANAIAVAVVNGLITP